MFSRYNERDPDDGLAKEVWGGNNHYENTELMLMRADGSGLRVLVPAKKGVFAVNSNRFLSKCYNGRNIHMCRHIIWGE